MVDYTESNRKLTARFFKSSSELGDEETAFLSFISLVQEYKNAGVPLPEAIDATEQTIMTCEDDQDQEKPLNADQAAMLDKFSKSKQISHFVK